MITCRHREREHIGESDFRYCASCKAYTVVIYLTCMRKYACEDFGHTVEGRPIAMLES